MVDIVVIGSLNMDLSIMVPRIPVPGETLTGSGLITSPGGKGANQAGACARLGKQVAMVGKVGGDDFGRQMIRNMQSFGVDPSQITMDDCASSGTAMILVDPKGENSIVVSPGANGTFSIEDVRAAEGLIQSAKIIILQLEIPLEAVIESIRLARHHHVPVLLNPAPARELPDKVYCGLDFLVPNETEAKELTGIEIDASDEQSLRRATSILLERGVKNVVITLGRNGAFYASNSQSNWIPPVNIIPVDTTAAGDAFIGGFAVAQIEELSVEESVKFACCCGALAATKQGAQTSLPSLQEVLEVYRPEGGTYNRKISK